MFRFASEFVFLVQGSRFGIRSSWCGVRGAGFVVPGSWCRVRGAGFELLREVTVHSSLFGVAFLLTVTMFAQAGAHAQSAAVPRDPAAVGYLNLHQRHPDALEGPQDFDSHSIEEGLRRLEQIRGFLRSFNRLTDRARGALNEAELRTIGDTDSTMQTIGFHNIPLLVEGTLMKQDYLLAQAKYELAELKFERRQISSDELSAAREAYRAATRRFQAFWDTKKPTD